ncbi:MAG TPA: flagellar motor switch protein FliN [Leptospiraceae bacterium]|nr:flagellar motor switch protein FliN [Leptospiraceae bacterium]HMY68156.1 flagellar motor switch protein FliN [Leptospiraceae bacterium]HMZ58505.1 flagellar motor switch protein FliN [Leptospiraceae bacterium]HNF13198.1 flagellar motor switch protein FliN [Leptospiraceae bacterium]HNF24607.1 flagellar motor switch protein FliN [Leptospiraceae bacterium]
MADGSLSQEEIDALLGSGFSGGDAPSVGGGSGEDDPLAGLGDFGGDSSSMNIPSSDAIAAALGTGGFTPPPPPKTIAKPTPMSGNSSNLNLLMDVTMSLTVELGRTNMLIKDILQLSEGAIVELDKAVGEDLDLLANGKIVGRGKIIVIDDCYGVQVTYIVNPAERFSMAQSL